MTLPASYARMNRDQAAAALREAGFSINSATLATRAARRTGPPTEVFSGRPIYEWASLLRWAQDDAFRKARSRKRVA